MAYQSRLFQSRWTYEPFDESADEFSSRVGRVLSRGAYSGELHASGTYASSIAPQEATSSGTRGADSNVLNQPTACTTKTSKQPSEYTWVDATGKPLDKTAASTSSQSMPSASGTAPGIVVRPYNKEVVELWRRVNPGVMEGYIQMPQSTMSDHFRWIPEEQEPLDMSRHLKKTDFSEYNEVAARSMKGLITNKGSA